MDKYNDFLAVQVLNEKSIVTYRTLSRALKVHVNLAKHGMLWDFHHRTNSRKPGSVHATYLLSGLRKTTASTSARTTQTRDGDDTVMASSPPLPGSSMPMQEEESEPTLVKSILLVKEEQLEKARATFVELRGIHIYSLQANSLVDYQILTDCTKTVFKLLWEEDPLKSGEQYGTIQNAFVRRRSRKTPLAPAQTLSAAAPKQVPAPVKEGVKPVVKANTTKAAAAKTASLKRQGSEIMASFAKNSQTKPKAAVKQESSKEEAEDSPMADVSDDDYGEAPDMDIDVKTTAGKSKLDRQAELEAMMDVEDEVKEDVNAEKEIEEEAVETPQADSEPEPKETVTTENGRRRGRRKVMKKKTAKDEEGFLVTSEEAVWESFSEDEPAPKKAKVSTPAPPAMKKVVKPGQGNIMSFFAKK